MYLSHISMKIDDISVVSGGASMSHISINELFLPNSSQKLFF